MTPYFKEQLGCEGSMSQHDTLTSTVDAIMEQAQVFASAWSLVGGMFDKGGMLEEANDAKAELREMVGAALSATQPAQAAQSEPVRHVGDSKFESWYQAHPKANGGDKQLARDAYAAGMSDPVAQGAGEVVAGVREALEFYANGGHEVELHGKIDWVAERDRLHDRGFHHVCEAYSGSETFVECGQKAQAALALMDTQPAAGADVLDAVSPVGDWSYSHDEERFSGQFDTKEAAIAEGLSCGARFVGQVNHVRDIISDGQIGWDIYERIGEILGDEIGEVAECFTLSPDQQDVLGKVVLDWIEAGPGFNCWGIKDVEPIDAAIAASGRQE